MCNWIFVIIWSMQFLNITVTLVGSNLWKWRSFCRENIPLVWSILVIFQSKNVQITKNENIVFEKLKNGAIRQGLVRIDFFEKHLVCIWPKKLVSSFHQTLLHSCNFLYRVEIQSSDTLIPFWRKNNPSGTFFLILLMLWHNWLITFQFSFNQLIFLWGAFFWQC